MAAADRLVMGLAETQDWDRINAAVVNVYGRAIERRR